MKLPKFIFNKVKEHRTSLGDNKAFPPEEDFPFDYKLLKKRLAQVTNNIQTLGISQDLGSVKDFLSSTITYAQKIERQSIDTLEKICRDFITKAFNIPDETIEFNCSITTKIEPTNKVRVSPEDSSSRSFDFDDLSHFDRFGDMILKRRLINSLIQGLSYDITLHYLKNQSSDLYLKLSEINSELPKLYLDIIRANDYILFNEEEKISDDRHMQGSYVEVFIGRQDEQTRINSQGIIFPFLFNETIRGLFELTASHNLPTNPKEANYLLSQSDFLMAEPWDLRLGVGLWRLLRPQGKINMAVLPYYFLHLIDEEYNPNFNETIREAFAQTKLGKKFIEETYNQALEDYHTSKAEIGISKSDGELSNKAKLNDAYLSVDDMDSDIIEEHTEEDNEFEDDEAERERLSNYTEITDNKEAIEILKSASIDNIDFIEVPIDSIPQIGRQLKMTYLKLVVDNNIIPIDVVTFMLEVVNFFGETYFQPHIQIKQEARGNNLTTKIYAKFVKLYGNLTSFFKNRKYTSYNERNADKQEDYAIKGVWDKLKSFNEFQVIPLVNPQTNKVVGETLTTKQ